MPNTYLIRYGAMAEVARVRSAVAESFGAGEAVVLRTQRGKEIGQVLGPAPATDEESDDAPAVLRGATAADIAAADTRRVESESEFFDWRDRIREWSLDLELIDLERTLDGAKLILYVLNERGPETTKLALRAAAAGFGVIEVQPVGPEGLIRAGGGGCGSGGCGRKH